MATVTLGAAFGITCGFSFTFAFFSESGVATMAFVTAARWLIKDFF
jgi:hypothetical protein